MLLVAEQSGLAPAQIHGQGDNSYMAMAVRVGEPESPKGYLVARVQPESLVSVFETALSEPGTFVFDQYNGRFKPTVLSNLAAAPGASEHIVWLNIPSSLFRIGIVQGKSDVGSLGILRPSLFVLGLLLLTLGVMLKVRPERLPM